MRLIKIILYCLLFYLFILPKPVQAYLDPGTGSYLVQILVAGILGSMFFIRNFIKKIKDFFLKIFSKQKLHSGAKERDEHK